MPGIGLSLLMIAAGAILKWAVTVNDTNGFNINTAGVILMIVGAVGLAASLIWTMTRRQTDVISRRPAGTSRTTYTESPPA